MFNHKQLREYIIQPALSAIGVYSKEAEELLVATGAVESKLGTYVKQINGPAIGLYQMEPATFTDVWSYIVGNSRFPAIMRACNLKNTPEAIDMVSNLRLSTIMARMHYMRFPEALPKPNDFEGIWSTYKKRWNTELGDTTRDEFLSAYKLATEN